MFFVLLVTFIKALNQSEDLGLFFTFYMDTECMFNVFGTHSALFVTLNINVVYIRSILSIAHWKTNFTRVFIKELKKINHEIKIYESKFPMSDPILADFGDG